MTKVTRLCSVMGCDRVAPYKSFCAMHYKRWKRTGSAEPATVEERFFGYVKPVEQWDACWVWTSWGSRDGYGRFGIGHRIVSAHRWSYEFFRAGIPDGLHLDHLCRNRACVNPWHLEPVSQRENTLRGETIPALNARKTHCKWGHEFTEANTYIEPGGGRECRTCRAAAQRRFESKFK